MQQGKPFQILLIEDNPGDARLIQLMLEEAFGRSGFSLERADRLGPGMELARQEMFDVVLLDLSLPDSHGLETFSRLHQAAPHVPVVVLSGSRDEALAVRAVHEGAQDYLVKGQVESHTLARGMRYAVERQAIAQERAELERQQREFFTSVSHDLRTPLAAIKASVGVLLANAPEDFPSALQKMHQNIDAAADEMSVLVEDILELARLQAGRVELWLAPVDLRSVVERSVNLIESLAGQREQRVETRLPPEPVLASVDAERLGRVLANLLRNAQRYGRERGVIRVSVSAGGNGAEVSVADDGPGVPLDEQERIFERFYQIDAGGHAPHQGSGLGLSIARAIVELHGGRIWIESSPGNGADFKFWIPTTTT